MISHVDVNTIYKKSRTKNTINTLQGRSLTVCESCFTSENIILVFTNVAETSDGGVYWEGMGEIPPNGTVTSWLGKPWTPGIVMQNLF